MNEPQGQITDGQAGRHGRKGATKRAFTLIELLVVVAVIMVLIGITLKISGVVARRAASAKTLKIIEQVKNALGEYYSAYGAYPPGDKADNGYSSIDYVAPPEEMAKTYATCEDWHSSTGLVYYLRYFGESPRWAHFTDGVIPNSSWDVETNAIYQGGTTPTYTNTVHTIVDGWERRLHYECSGTNDYQAYRLWSDGPNNRDDGGLNDGTTNRDDIGVQWGE